MFRPEKCDFCGDCFVDCPWMELERDEAIAWMRDLVAGKPAPVLDGCITCFACNEICPQDANPFDLIAALQEEHGRGAPEQMIAATEARYRFEGELRDLPQAERVLTTCVFGKSDVELMQGELYDLPRVGGKPFFCWLLFGHMGAESVQRKHARAFVDRLAATGAREVVCFHDDCYSMLARYAPAYGIEVPFRPVHLVEHLVGHLRQSRERLRPLGLRVAYQRPCASRLTPDKEPFVDELFQLAGATRVERTFDRGGALCCGGAKFLLGRGDPEQEQEKNLRDALDAGAEALIYLCPMCRNTLTGVAERIGLPLVFIGDIARKALGEIQEV